MTDNDDINLRILTIEHASGRVAKLLKAMATLPRFEIVIQNGDVSFGCGGLDWPRAMHAIVESVTYSDKEEIAYLFGRPVGMVIDDDELVAFVAGSDAYEQYLDKRNRG